jgi:hypothetical protein
MREGVVQKNNAAVQIQASWRGFWQYSHYVIVQYETIRIQAVVRGNISRRVANMRLGCCIIIQSAVRRYFAMRAYRKLQIQTRVDIILALAAANAMREIRACERIQFWWRVVMDCRREKHAALVIERFFIMVKAEVEREIRRVERKKNSKKEQRRKKQKEAEDHLLEKVWLNTVDENRVDVFAYSPTSTSNSPQSRSSMHPSPSLASNHTGRQSRSSDVKGIRHRASSPSMNLVMRHELDSQGSASPRSPDSLLFSFSEEPSVFSALTSSTMHQQQQQRPKQVGGKSKAPSKICKDIPLEMSYSQSTTKSATSGQSLRDKYSGIIASSSVPSKTSGTHHFFADDLESPTSDESLASPTFEKSKQKAVPIPTTSNGVTKAGNKLSLPSPSAASPLETPRRLQLEKMKLGRYSPKKSSVPSPSTSAAVQREATHVTSASKSQRRRESTKPSPTNSRYKESPRHGKILVMNAYPSYPTAKKNFVVDDIDEEFLGEEFGMI